LVGRGGFEPPTNGLKVRCSTKGAHDLRGNGANFTGRSSRRETPFSPAQIWRPAAAHNRRARICKLIFPAEAQKQVMYHCCTQIVHSQAASGVFEMPLFMDRHDVPGADADAVNQAHLKDLEGQHQHHCKAHTYWFDEARGAGFCLIEAPSAEAVRDLHRNTHGLLPNKIIEVDAATVSQFFGRLADPEDASKLPIRESAFRAIMFVDMVGSTQITQALGDSEALTLVRRYREIVRRALATHAGREVDRAGDGFLTCFESAYAAVACATEIQRGLSEDRAKRDDGHAVRARIGIGAGEPVVDGDALFGSTINLVARICDRASADEILVARVVRDLCLGKSANFTAVGDAELRGFDEPVPLERVDWQA
jgi:class 3 adenylate cyclase